MRVKIEHDQDVFVTLQAENDEEKRRVRAVFWAIQKALGPNNFSAGCDVGWSEEAGYVSMCVGHRLGSSASVSIPIG